MINVPVDLLGHHPIMPWTGGAYLMIPMQRCFLVLLLVHVLSRDATPAPQRDERPSFLKEGGTYFMRYALPDQAGDLFVKIVEFGPDQWLRVQHLVRPASIRSLKSSGNAPKPGTVQNEGWVNFAMIGAVGLPDDTGATATAVSENSKADVTPFPKVGTVYYFGSGRVATPYFAKVIETLPNGWFRVQTMPFREQPVPPGPREWWIDRSQLGAMQEAKPPDVPE